MPGQGWSSSLGTPGYPALQALTQFPPIPTCSGEGPPLQSWPWPGGRDAAGPTQLSYGVSGAGTGPTNRWAEARLQV